jgi:hypothetical protein
LIGPESDWSFYIPQATKCNHKIDISRNIAAKLKFETSHEPATDFRNKHASIRIQIEIEIYVVIDEWISAIRERV